MNQVDRELRDQMIGKKMTATLIGMAQGNCIIRRWRRKASALRFFLQST